MKVAIALTQVPFVTGGAETHAHNLRVELERRGHRADVVTIPFKWYPEETLVESMAIGRMLDLTEVNGERVDVLVPLKFPAYYAKHPCKVVWLCHQHRQAYDLWGSEYGDLHRTASGERVRQMILNSDNLALSEARAIYTVSRNVSARLQRFNGIDSTPLYHPPPHAERFHCARYGDFVFYPSRIDPLKRQRLLVEAAARLRGSARIVLAGNGSSQEIAHLKELICRNGLAERVVLLGHVSEEEKIQLYAECLAVYFGTHDEDYGYVSLEAQLASKPVFIHPDAGGPLEFVVHGESGIVVLPDAGALAEAIDALAADRARARRLGEAGRASLLAKNVTWDHVVAELLRHADA